MAANDTDSFHRHPPEQLPENKFFWDQCEKDHFVVQYCETCDAWQYPPRTVCKCCWRADHLQWREPAGHGTIYSYTIVHRAPDAELQKIAPYVVALIDITEGPRMLANVLSDPSKVQIGKHVRLTIEHGEGYALPQFVLSCTDTPSTPAT